MFNPYEYGPPEYIECEYTNAHPDPEDVYQSDIYFYSVSIAQLETES